MHRFTQLVSCLIDQLLTDLLQGLQSTPGHNPYSDAAAQTGCFRFAQEVCTTMQHTHSEPFVTSLSVHCSLLSSRRHTHTHTHARTHARLHACTHARTHARTHTRVHVMQKNVQYNAMHAVLASNAFDGRKILKKVTKGTWTNKGCTIDPCSLVNAAGVAFTTLRRMEGSTQGFGNGFVLARYTCHCVQVSARCHCDCTSDVCCWQFLRLSSVISLLECSCPY